MYPSEKEIENIARACTWRRDTVSSTLPASSRGYMGTVGVSRVIVADFDISDQGFPAGSRGYDGAVSMGRIVMRLPRSLAEKIFCIARASVISTLRTINLNTN